MRHGTRSPTCPHCKMRRLMDKACNCAGTSPISRQDWIGSIVKPHGSISWRRCRNSKCCQYECLVADAHCQPFQPSNCPNCRCQCGPVIVLPSMSKNLSDIPAIATMWDVCQRAVEEASSLLVFGFSFPASDQLLHYVLRKGLCKNSRTVNCAVIDLNPHDVAIRLAAMFPASGDITIHEFQVEKRKRPTWLQAVNN